MPDLTPFFGFSRARMIAVFAAFGVAGASCSAVPNPLANEPNPGPCPRAYSLYDASRLVEIRGEEVAYENVGFTAEIEDVRSICRYFDDRPIEAELEVDIGFGRGPAAESDRHTYNLFVAVTRGDVAVIERQVFPVEVRFDRGEDRVYQRERFDPIRIPRADADISGSNFEILVGFDLTEEQLDFNRQGLRFRVDAGQ